LCCSFPICGGARSESRFLFRSRDECPLDLISSRLIFHFSRSSVFGLLAASLAAGFCSPLVILVCGSVSAARPLISGSLTQGSARFSATVFCAVSHWSAACSGLDFVAAAALLVSARRYLFWPVWSVPPRMFDTQGVILDSAAHLILFCHQ
jgi:hypothetical protein